MHTLLCRSVMHQMPQGTFSTLSCAWMSGGGEEKRPSGRERDLKHGRGFLQQPAVCWRYGGNAPEDQIVHFRLVPTDKH